MSWPIYFLALGTVHIIIKVNFFKFLVDCHNKNWYKDVAELKWSIFINKCLVSVDGDRVLEANSPFNGTTIDIVGSAWKLQFWNTFSWCIIFISNDKFIRAIVTLYLAMSLLHTVHSRMKSVFFESQQKRIKIGTLVVVLCIVALAVLDIVVVNDVILINNNDAHISALGVNDVYTSGAGTTGKNRNKEFQLYLDYLISSVVLGYR